MQRPIGDHGNPEAAPFSVALRNEHPLDRSRSPRVGVALQPGGHLGLFPSREHDPAVDPGRLAASVELGDPPHTQQSVCVGTQHQLLQITDPLEVPACIAVKIRRRSLRTSSSTWRQSTASQSMISSSGPFTVTVSNLPIGSGVSDHLVFTGSPDHVSSLSGRAARPYPTGYAATIWRRSQIVRLPVSRCLSVCRHRLLGSSSACRGVAPSPRSAYRQNSPDPNRVVMLRMNKIRPGRVPPLPRGR
ncbi:hypothetical protein I546_6882 [Mycobacterium kansasii 732]|nr:hypothetical protein I546_6882 [Mycobacterium kansasii 732]